MLTVVRLLFDRADRGRRLRRLPSRLLRRSSAFRQGQRSVRRDLPRQQLAVRIVDGTRQRLRPAIHVPHSIYI